MIALRSLVKRALGRLLGNVHGATAIEYGLIAALIVIAMMAALREMASTTTVMWNNVSDKVSNAIGAP